jgi:hypothetical protein
MKTTTGLSIITQDGGGFIKKNIFFEVYNINESVVMLCIRSLNYTMENSSRKSNRCLVSQEIYILV